MILIFAKLVNVQSFVSNASLFSCVWLDCIITCAFLLICPLDKLTSCIQLWDTASFYPPCALFAVYLVLRCEIRRDGKAYSSQISSQSIPENINDVLLIGVHREFRGLRQNKQQAPVQKLFQAAKHRSFLCASKMLKAGFPCVLHSVHNLIRLNNCCSAKRRLPRGEKCPFSSFALLSAFFFLKKTVAMSFSG